MTTLSRLSRGAVAATALTGLLLLAPIHQAEAAGGAAKARSASVVTTTINYPYRRPTVVRDHRQVPGKWCDGRFHCPYGWRQPSGR